jgi:hypothetical protein
VGTTNLTRAQSSPASDRVHRAEQRGHVALPSGEADLVPNQALFEGHCLGLGLSEPKARRFWVSRGERGEGALRKPPWKNLDPKQRGALDLGLVSLVS